MDFTELYNRISPRLKRIAVHYRNYCPSLDADDLYQVMCCYLWEHFKDGQGMDMSDYYIARGCEFHLLNFMRLKRNREFLRSLEEPINENGDMLKDVLSDNCEDISRRVDRKITIDTIMNNGFTKREKEVFGLLLKGYTTRETGERLGISHVMVVKSKKNLIKKWQDKENRLPEK